MKGTVFIILFVILYSPVFSQDAGQINFINELAAKKVATFGDAVKLYVYILGKGAKDFNANVTILKDLKILKAKQYDKDKPLRRGMLALMIARHMNMKQSLFFLMFDTQRYAIRACIAGKFMDSNISEWDLMTGDELLEVMSLVSEKMEEK